MKKTWYQLPEDQCERMNRTEFSSLKWCLSAVNSVAYAQDDLAKRLECIPEGKRRWRLMLGQLRALLNDLVGTIPRKQCVTLKNLMNDMELRLVPKTSFRDKMALITIDDLSYLVYAAKSDKCMVCTFDGEECRKCELYKILESITPLEDWGDSTMCPYNREGWEDQ